MKYLKFFLFTLLITFISCNSDPDDNPIPIVNTDEYFRYTIDNEPERVFFVSAKGNYVETFDPSDPTSYSSFYFNAIGENYNGNESRVVGFFSFPNQDLAGFLSTSSFPWGINNVSTTFKFRFYESTEGRYFLAHMENIPVSNAVNCNVTTHATNVGEYIEFNFSGDVYLDNTTSNPIPISGSGRVLREANQ